MNRVVQIKLCLLLTGLMFPLTVLAQLIIPKAAFDRNVIYDVTLELKDSLTKEPLSFASVYVHHPKDSLITNFTLSDQGGKAVLKEVNRGEYVLTAELMGYKPFKKRLYIDKDTDLGVAYMAEDVQALKAASVSAVANPIEVRQDTVIYNAAAFHILEGDKLIDLLRKMPGFEVDGAGNIKVNGEKVNKLTVGGRTFFADDNSMALNHLPAKIVDNIKVIDQDTREAQFSGIRQDKEKVVDVGLKKEYQKGVFGDVTANIGAGLAADRPYIDNEDLLYKLEGMLAAYNETDQLTAIGGTTNYVDKQNTLSISGSGLLDDGGLTGTQTSSQAGINLNTFRIRGFDTNGTVNYRTSTKESRQMRDRTTYRSEGTDDVLSHTESDDDYKLNSLSFSFRTENKNISRYRFSVSQQLIVQNAKDNKVLNSNTDLGSGSSNLSESITGYRKSALNYSGTLSGGINNLGKPSRSLQLSASVRLVSNSGDQFESSKTEYGMSGYSISRYLDYDLGGRTGQFSTFIQYVEPLSKNWNSSVRLAAIIRSVHSDKDAFNADRSRNDYYSLHSDEAYNNYNGNFVLQNAKGRRVLHLGASVMAVRNYRHTVSLGRENRTGENDWVKDISPYISFANGKQGLDYSFRWQSGTELLGANSTSSTFDITDPTRISAGNIYLRQSYNNRINAQIRKSNAPRQTNYGLSLSLVSKQRPIVYASWFDAEGVYYSIPVNSKTPSLNLNANLSAGFPLNKSKSLFASMGTDGWVSSNVGYQSNGTLAGIDLNTADYLQFMEGFWGTDESGKRFYSGESGFQKNRTTSINMSYNLSLKWRLEKLTLEARCRAGNNRVRYSLNPSANVNVWRNTYSLDATWSAPLGFALSGMLAYNDSHGYLYNYNRPYTSLSLNIEKQYRALLFSIRGQDLLDQTRNYNRTVTSDYIEDSWYNSYGRMIVFGVTYNFGKLNAKKKDAASRAAHSMIL